MTKHTGIMQRLLAFVLYQGIWFLLVIGAGRGAVTPGIIAALGFTGWLLARDERPWVALRRVALAVAMGVFVDGVPATMGWWHYASPQSALPAGGAPAWILALWAAFGASIPLWRATLERYPMGTALLGAVGGPASYLGAAHGWQAVVFPSPQWPALLWLAVCWAVCIPVLASARLFPQPPNAPP